VCGAQDCLNCALSLSHHYFLKVKVATLVLGVGFKRMARDIQELEEAIRQTQWCQKRLTGYKEAWQN
jgi:hypothetical protein